MATPSKYQQAIYDFAASSDQNGMIRAGAGCGKTYTGVQMTRKFKPVRRGMMAYPPKIAFLAFNKPIQLELEAKLGDAALAKTYHSFGLGAINNRKLKITAFKNNDLLRAHFGDDLKPIFPLISKIAGLFKGDLNSEVTHESVLGYIDKHTLDLSEEDEPYFDEIVEGVQLCLDPSHVERLGKIDYDDMIWYPLVCNLPIPQFDVLLVDEFQDSNLAQMELVMRANARVIAIGDGRQAIYFWRGAGMYGMEIFQQRTNAVELPLSISYRCPRAVVANVNQKYPDIPFEAWDQAIEGEVNTISENKMFTQAQSGDMILCRLNAPLVAPAMRFLREGKKAIIKGRDTSKTLMSLIHKVEQKFYPQNIQEFVVDLDDYVNKETEKLRATQRFNQATTLEDTRDTVWAFADGSDSVADIKEKINRIFSDDTVGIVLSTGHKAKGLEADNVYVIHPEMFPFKRARTLEQKAQEINLAYVTDTRAKVSHNYVV